MEAIIWSIVVVLIVVAVIFSILERKIINLEKYFDAQLNKTNTSLKGFSDCSNQLCHSYVAEFQQYSKDIKAIMDYLKITPHTEPEKYVMKKKDK